MTAINHVNITRVSVDKDEEIMAEQFEGMEDDPVLRRDFIASLSNFFMIPIPSEKLEQMQDAAPTAMAPGEARAIVEAQLGKPVDELLSLAVSKRRLTQHSLGARTEVEQSPPRHFDVEAGKRV